MNQDLDNPHNFVLPDQENHVLSSIKLLADQLQDGISQAQSATVPKECFVARNLVFCGMGGSALGARIIKSALQNKIRTPFEIVTDFEFGHYVGSNSLVIISSYSGNTAEALSCLYKAQAVGAKVMAITAGGKLGQEVKNGLAGVLFKPDQNPSEQPRLGLGYSIGAFLAMLKTCQFVSLTDLEQEEAIKALRKSLSDFAPDKPESENQAKKLALAFRNQAAILIASGHLLGACHACKNQLNETGKNFSVLFDLPELNHHLMEGLKHPALIKSQLKFLLFESDLYLDEVKKRYPITAEVVSKNEIATISYQAQAGSKLGQALEVTALGAYISFYLAYLRRDDPSKIPWVDYFKERLQ